mgnify:CR=1 FL=1
MTTSKRPAILDTALIMKDDGLIAASAAATVASVATILDVGNGFTKGTVVVEVTAIEVATGDEIYSIEVQGSNSSSFASGIVILSQLRVGDSTVSFESADSTVGTYRIPVENEKLGTHYRYMRIYTRVAGTVATGINYNAFLTKHIG